jgi:hypothetical protein
MKITAKTALLFIALGLSSVFAQEKKFDKIDAEITKQTNELLLAYYDVKDALVATNGKLTSTKSKVFLDKLNNLNTSKLTSAQKDFYKPLKDKIAFDAEHINETQDAEHQRDHFGDLSTNVLSLVKAFGANQEETYVQYCPMVKKSWLSNNKAIKNPYYGDKMLACGKVTETLEKNK